MVSANLSESLETIRLGEELGIVMLEPPGPWPLTVDHGMRAAIAFLENNLKPGVHEAQVKFATARKTRAVFSKNWMRSPFGVAGASYWRSDAKRFVSANLSTDSEWYSRFIKGAKSRMGEHLKQDLAISIGVMLELQRLFEEDFAGADTLEERRAVTESPVRASSTIAVSAGCATERDPERKG
jgi:hypothetical protein